MASFKTAPAVGAKSTVSFIAVADLGHTEIDGSDEWDYDVSLSTDGFNAFETRRTPPVVTHLSLSQVAVI